MATVVGLVVLAAAAIAFARSNGPGSDRGAGGEARAAVGGGHGAGAGQANGGANVSGGATVNGAGPLGAGILRAEVSAEGHDVNRVLAYTPYARLLTHGRRDVALTFDDGPSPYTPPILRTLTRWHAKATFFAIGYAVRHFPGFVRDEARAGFEIGDHTETHAYLQQLSPLEQVHEVEDQAEALRHVGAPSPVLFRPPYGSFDATTMSILHSQRMLMVLWSVDTSDYARPGVAHIVDAALSGVTRGSIILLHDGGGDRSETVAALPKIIRGLRRRHFHLVTVAQLIHDDPPPHHQPPPTPLSGVG
jgi:peptidoglycan/xylan/chitin deacetylase (PgdA/CDA1 family)